jgi:hypothetical protein
VEHFTLIVFERLRQRKLAGREPIAATKWRR